LGAAAVAYGLGFSFQEIKDGLATCNPPKMRMQPYSLKNGAVVINDAYNANPTSMQESIKSLAQSYPNREIILVLGDMLELGEKSAEYHAELGKYINSLQNIKSVYLFGDLVNHLKRELLDIKSKFFISKSILCDEIIKDITENSLIFIKASRGMKLDEVYDEIIAVDKIKRGIK
jgi:UDP-N-acetylmuramoyl-tripeptide--D-alanyl-D-alanine ligase